MLQTDIKRMVPQRHALTTITTTACFHNFSSLSDNVRSPNAAKTAIKEEEEVRRKRRRRRKNGTIRRRRTKRNS